jgi:hypothetical protein
MRSSSGRVSTLAVALAVGFGGGATGCGLVVGSGDYVVGSVDAGGGSKGGPDASQTVPPDDGAIPPESDATAEPDAPGSAEAGSPPPTEAGTTADGGPTDVCANGAVVPGGLPTGDPAFQQLVNACVLAVSCDPLFFDVTVSDCINRDYLNTFFPNKCLADITSCDDYYACQGSRIATLSECSEASNEDTDIGTCNAGIATSCFGSGDGIVFDCGVLGGTCTTYHESDYADFGDTAAGCQILSNCTDPTDNSLHCGTSSQLYVCAATDTSATLGIGRTCPAGSTCQTSNGNTDCYFSAPSCTTPGTSCANGQLTTCIALTSDNQQYTNGCATAGLECGGTPAACVAPGCSDCTEGCNADGTGLQICIGGAPFTVDCTALGFNTCDTGTFNKTTDNDCAYQ